MAGTTYRIFLLDKPIESEVVKKFNVMHGI
jgi:hypothetical protein